MAYREDEWVWGWVFAVPHQMSLFMSSIGTVRTVLEKKSWARAASAVNGIYEAMVSKPLA